MKDIIDFNAALAEFEKLTRCADGTLGYDHDGDSFVGTHEASIRLALTICQRLMEEPSEGMWEEGYIASGEKVTGNDCMAIFRAMIEQMIREIEHD